MLLEMGRFFGRPLVTGLARVDGIPIGVMANDSRFGAGSIDADAAEKMTRFVDLCDTFYLPVVNFVDNPGFMVGVEAEKRGTIRKGVRALTAVFQASTPWCSFIVRKAFGVAGAGHSDHTPAARADAIEMSEHIGHSQQASLRRGGIGAEHQEVVGAVEIGDGDAPHPAIHQRADEILRPLVDGAG